MDTTLSTIKVRGKSIEVPSIRIDDRTVIVTGKWVRIAAVRGEEWSAGQGVADPDLFVTKLKESGLKADIFAFSQKLPDTQPRYKYHIEWDNVAAIPITSFAEWWEKRLPQVTRKSIRRAGKRGVIAKATEFNDELVEGIIGVHNDTPMRQGRPFAHYGKDFDLVKKEYGTYEDRSQFVGAYFGSELIGIIKLIYLGNSASIMQILTKTQHYDKRPTNVLIAKAVEICEKKNIPFLIFGKFVYGKKTSSSLTEFKRRNGFEQILLPRYYIPLTLKGKIALKLKLHLGLLGMLPSGAISFLRDLRSRYVRFKLLLKPSGKSPLGNQNEEKTSTEGE